MSAVWSNSAIRDERVGKCDVKREAASETRRWTASKRDVKVRLFAKCKTNAKRGRKQTQDRVQPGSLGVGVWCFRYETTMA